MDKVRCLISLTLLLAVSTARSESALETCRQAGDDKTRIACLEGAVSALEAQLSRQQSPAAIAAPARNLGAEQVKGEARDAVKKAERIQAGVSSFSFDGFGRMTVTLDNGQTWQQLDGDSTKLKGRIRDDDKLQADITRSRFGGYRIQLTPPGKTIRVRRQQ